MFIQSKCLVNLCHNPSPPPPSIAEDLQKREEKVHSISRGQVGGDCLGRSDNKIVLWMILCTRNDIQIIRLLLQKVERARFSVCTPSPPPLPLSSTSLFSPPPSLPLLLLTNPFGWLWFGAGEGGHFCIFVTCKSFIRLLGWSEMN